VTHDPKRTTSASRVLRATWLTGNYAGAATAHLALRSKPCASCCAVRTVCAASIASDGSAAVARMILELHKLYAARPRRRPGKLARVGHHPMRRNPGYSGCRLLDHLLGGNGYTFATRHPQGHGDSSLSIPMNW
jgi:hypothetical protein